MLKLKRICYLKHAFKSGKSDAILWSIAMSDMPWILLYSQICVVLNCTSDVIDWEINGVGSVLGKYRLFIYRVCPLS